MPPRHPYKIRCFRCMKYYLKTFPVWRENRWLCGTCQALFSGRTYMEVTINCG